MALLRHRHRALTAVLPHQANRHWAIPARGVDIQFPGTRFNGSDQYVEKTTGMAGGQSKQCTFSVFLSADGGDGTDRYIMRALSGGSNRIQWRLTPGANSLSLLLVSAGNTVLANIQTLIAEMTGQGQYHWLLSIDLATGTVQSYVNGLLNNATIPTLIDDFIDFDTDQMWLGSDLSPPSNTWDGCLSEVYINTEVAIDLSDPANRALFITPRGHPVDLGENGELPTGSAPMLYSKDGGNSLVNRGTGGNFDFTSGEPGACITGPVKAPTVDLNEVYDLWTRQTNFPSSIELLGATPNAGLQFNIIRDEPEISGNPRAEVQWQQLMLAVPERTYRVSLDVSFPFISEYRRTLLQYIDTDGEIGNLLELQTRNGNLEFNWLPPGGEPPDSVPRESYFFPAALRVRTVLILGPDYFSVDGEVIRNYGLSRSGGQAFKLGIYTGAYAQWPIEIDDDWSIHHSFKIEVIA